MTIRTLILAGVCATAIGCGPAPSSSSAPTPDAKAFLDNVNSTTLKLGWCTEPSKPEMCRNIDE